ncbi:unnamed protein product [Chondrus crispus]|uniref:Uncharacterized protein n=1 Tax=Chondrus crispus TaxID=2769 RepID=R7QME8_CHOCR|nr:unnamed protein product [Chondrus crispus]CDF38938.1 unnamed protein product [Chondrus crispus]|eukprot:XP_005718843.1 unnamed protein product [Chondrus crispus]
MHNAYDAPSAAQKSLAHRSPFHLPNCIPFNADEVTSASCPHVAGREQVGVWGCKDRGCGVRAASRGQGGRWCPGRV